MPPGPAPKKPEDVQASLDAGSTYIAYFDGLCEPINPGGVATYGIVIKQGGRTLFEESGLAYAKPWTDESSNNVAEYSAAIRALEWLKKNDAQGSPVILRGDSRLIINQLKGEFKVKAKRILPLYRQASKLISEFGNLKLEWVDRSKNSEADRLSRMAYRKYRSETRLTQTPFNKRPRSG
jgi:ribonuclease HI